MSRNNITKTGMNGDLVFARKNNRNHVDIEGRLRKKEKKRKGLRTGNRNSDAQSQSFSGGVQQRDPRLGSKKKIPLIVETSKKLSKPERRLSAEKELELLENDAQLTVLLERLENGEKLGAGLQQYVDQKLARIEQLMKVLGLFDTADDGDDAPVSEPVKRHQPKKAVSDDDALLDKFAESDWDELER